MVKIKYWIIAILAVAMGIGAAVHLFPSDVRKVKKQFGFLSEWVSKDLGENTFTLAHKTRSLSTLFAEKFEIKTEIESMSGSYSPEEISSYAARGRLMFSYLSLSFHDLDISFPEKGVAEAVLTARLKGRSTAGENFDETHELECILRKIGKKWLFSHVEIVEVLKK